MVKDKTEIQRYKNQMINQLKKVDKEDIFKKEEVKLSLWQRLKKVIMGY